MTRARQVAIALAALAAGAVSCAVVLASDHQEAKAAFAIFGPAVGWGFVGTGLWAWRREPENRTGKLLVLLGFAWLFSTLEASNAALPYTVALTLGGIWGAFFLHLGMTFPHGRLRTGFDRGVVIAGYVIFPLAFVPALFFAAPVDLDCAGCPENVLLIERDEDLAAVLLVLGPALYGSLFLVALVRAVGIWRAADPFERLQLTPVYSTALLTFLLVTVAKAGAGDAAWWAAFIAAWMTPFAFLGGLLRSHLAVLVQELRASRARIVEAGTAERRRLERDLHDGAQSRLVALALLLRAARSRAGDGDPALTELLDRAQEELQTSLDELRELARGIHPAVLTDRGLEPALEALTARAPVPVTLAVESADRLPEPIESTAYFVVSEALTNVAKYAQATQASVAVRRLNGSVTVEVSDDGVGGADASGGSGLRGLADRLGAIDGTLSLESPAGQGTRLRAVIPVANP
jgi:signal transduction histidine kinase